MDRMQRTDPLDLFDEYLWLQLTYSGTGRGCDCSILFVDRESEAASEIALSPLSLASAPEAIRQDSASGGRLAFVKLDK